MAKLVRLDKHNPREFESKKKLKNVEKPKRKKNNNNKRKKLTKE